MLSWGRRYIPLGMDECFVMLLPQRESIKIVRWQTYLKTMHDFHNLHQKIYRAAMKCYHNEKP